MTQIQTTLWEQLARVGLWVILVVLPFLLYLLVICGDIVALGPLRGDISAILVSFGWPTLLGVLGTVLLLLLARLISQYLGRSLRVNKIVQPVVIGIKAYFLGCLMHWLLPSALLYCFVFMPPFPDWKPVYWWPLSEFLTDDVPAGWTLFPPLSMIQLQSYALVPPIEAACIKLGTLLATLLMNRSTHPQGLSATLDSAKPIQSA
jgi:hypothetical protein